MESNIYDISGSIEVFRESVSILKNDIYYSDQLIFEIMIPTFDRAELLDAAIQSAINQDYDYFYGITVIDNDPNEQNSTQAMILNKYSQRVKYFKNSINIGGIANWNKCLELSKAKWICILADDDLLMPNYLSSMEKIIHEYPNTSLITNSPNLLYMNKIHNDSFDSKTLAIFKKLNLYIMQGRAQKVLWYLYLSGNKTNSCAMLYNREKLYSMNGWNINESSSGDWFLNARMSKKYLVIKLHFPLSIYRIGFNDSLKFETQVNILVQDVIFLLNNKNKLSKLEKFIFAPGIDYSIYKSIKKSTFEIFEKSSTLLKDYSDEVTKILRMKKFYYLYGLVNYYGGNFLLSYSYSKKCRNIRSS